MLAAVARTSKGAGIFLHRASWLRLAVTVPRVTKADKGHTLLSGDT